MTEKENVLKFMQYIEKLAKVYEFNIPYGSYDIYAFAKDLLVWLEKQGEQKPQGKSALEAIKEEQRDLLFQKMKESGYEWDAEKKELKKLVIFGCKAPNRFDPKTLKEFDKVLVKDDGDWIWRVDIISVPAKYNDNIPYLIGDNDFDWIIPYNEDTKHLIGTSDDAPEYYKYWDD